MYKCKLYILTLHLCLAPHRKTISPHYVYEQHTPEKHSKTEQYRATTRGTFAFITDLSNHRPVGRPQLHGSDLQMKTNISLQQM